jgi:hypothetical protein
VISRPAGDLILLKLEHYVREICDRALTPANADPDVRQEIPGKSVGDLNAFGSYLGE